MNPHNFAPDQSGSLFELDEGLLLTAMCDGASALVGPDADTLLGQPIDLLLTRFAGDLTEVQAALDRAGDGAADAAKVTEVYSILTLLPLGTSRAAQSVEAVFALDHGGEGFQGMTMRAFASPLGPLAPAHEAEPPQVSPPNAFSLGEPIIHREQKPADLGLVDSLERFGSRFDFVAMAVCRVENGELHPIEVWNSREAETLVPELVSHDDSSSGNIDSFPDLALVLSSEASGPQFLGNAPPLFASEVLKLTTSENLSLAALRLDLPSAPGLLIGARGYQDNPVSPNFHRTLRDLGWVVTQFIARTEAEEALTMQLQLQDTLRTIATGFLAIAPEQRASALRESLWRFGTAVGARRLTLWMIDDPEEQATEPTARLEAQYTGTSWPLASSEICLPNLDENTVIHSGQEMHDLGLKTTRGEPAFEPRDRMIVVPLRSERHLVGCIIAIVDPSTRWSAAHSSGLDSLGSLLISFLARIENEERFDRAFFDGPIPAIWRRTTGELIRCNTAFAEFMGFESAHAAVGQRLEQLIDTNVCTTEMETALGSLDLESEAPLELPFTRNDGQVIWGRIVNFRVQRGSDAIVLSHIEDVTASRAIHKQFEHQASHDELTGLSNRRGLLEQLDQLIGSNFEATTAAVLLIDVDRFKVINDSLGHAAGDELLLLLGQRLRESLRPTDIVARLGGDEFVVVLPGPLTEASAQATAEKLLAQMSGQAFVDNQEVFTSISMGIAFPHPDDSAASDVLRHADAAMYEAKKNGRNCFEMFDQRTRSAVALRSAAESDLRRALDNKDFIAHFQPEFDLRSGEILGVEALVRWPHPTRGLLLASEVIPLAEETGLIADIGALVLGQACKFASEWARQQGSRPFQLRVNMSARQLEDFSIIDTVVGCLMANNMDASQLCLEVTETALMRDPKHALRILNILVREVGVSIAVDDFGTGFSSLAYLKRLPVKTLKIDREFIIDLTTNTENVAIVDAIVALAKSMHLEIVAEGIEDAETAAKLVSLGITRGQGYHLSAPIPADAIDDLLIRAAMNR